MNAIRTILVPTDLSEKTPELLRLAGTIARDRGARLVLLHVTPKPPLPEAPVSPVAREQVKHAEEDWSADQWETAERLRSLRPAGDGVPVEHLLKQGNRADVILHTASELGCDLIVMETHSKSEEERRLFGSVVTEVLRHAPCPVFMLNFASGEARSSA